MEQIKPWIFEKTPGPRDVVPGDVVSVNCDQDSINAQSIFHIGTIAA